MDKLGIDELKNTPTNLSNLKCKVDKLDVDKLVPALADSSKLSDRVKNDAVIKDVYNAIEILNMKYLILLTCLLILLLTLTTLNKWG